MPTAAQRDALACMVATVLRQTDTVSVADKGGCLGRRKHQLVHLSTGLRLPHGVSRVCTQCRSSDVLKLMLQAGQL